MLRRRAANTCGRFEQQGLYEQRSPDQAAVRLTSVPGTPDFICGIINLRGRIIPIVDLRRKFGMESKEQTSETCIIVVHVQGVEVGTVVDRVSEVLNISSGDIEPPPSFGKDVNTD